MFACAVAECQQLRDAGKDEQYVQRVPGNDSQKCQGENRLCGHRPNPQPARPQLKSRRVPADIHGPYQSKQGKTVPCALALKEP